MLDLLNLHGIQHRRLASAPPGEVFAIDSMQVAERAFQGRRAVRLYGRWQPSAAASIRHASEYAYVPLDQPLGRLAFSLLEPRSDDGVVAWAVLPEETLRGHGDYPILRVHQPPD